MGSRKTLILIASVAIAGVGAFILWGWLGGIQDRANADAATVDVLVVKQDIPAGTYGQEAEAVIEQAKQQKRFVPANAVKDPKQIVDRVAATDLLPNQILTSDMFVSPDSAVASSGMAGRLDQIRDQDQVTVTVQVDQVRGAAGLIEPGDFVNVMVLKTCALSPDGQCVGAPAEADPAKTLFVEQARFVFQKAEVLAVDQQPKLDAAEQAEASSTAEGGEGAEPATAETDAGLITLRVPAKAAQVIASLPPENIYLSLVSRDYEPVPQDPINPEVPLPAENPEILTPYGPEGPPVKDS